MLNDTFIQSQKRTIYIFSVFLIVSFFVGIYFEQPFIILAPAGIVFLYILLTNYKVIYFLLLASIPISLHVSFGSLAMDFLSEPLMICLLGICPFIILIRHKEINFINHPVILLIAALYFWAIFTTFFSVDHVVSIKYLIAKLWFIFPFVFLSLLLIKGMVDIKIIFWCIFIPILFICLYTTINHAAKGFTFEASNFVMEPFFRNHVDYSTLLAVFLPFIFPARKWYPNYSWQRIFINLGLLILVISIYLSYTRASWLAVTLLIPSYFIIKKGLMKLSLGIGVVALIGILIYLYYENRYLEYSIEYKKVIFHEESLGKHLEATYQMQDVSGMERLYRWVAAQNMIKDKFFTGSGPNTFYPEYKRHTLAMFTTYVSDNPEKSTSHNYFLMIFSEQGLVGFLLFTGLYFYLLIKGAQLSTAFKDEGKNRLATATTLSLIALALHLIFNDMIETDKIGSLYYLFCAFIIILDRWNKEEKNQETLQEI